MATLAIPTPPASSFGFLVRVNLEGVFYRLQFKWNGRDESWYLDIGDDGGNATVRNLRLVIGDDILAPHKSIAAAKCPQGNLRVVDTEASGVEAERDELGGRVLLLYDEASG